MWWGLARKQRRNRVRQKRKSAEGRERRGSPGQALIPSKEFCDRLYVAGLQLDFREPRQGVSEHRDPTLHQVSQERSIAIKLDVQRIGHGQHHVTIRYTFVERATDVSHPLIHVHFAAGEAEATLATEGHPFLFQAM